MNIDLTVRQKEIATGLSILLVVGLGFGLGEAAVRLTQMLKFGVGATVEKSAMYHRDPATGLRVPVPNVVRGAVRINSLGFRSPELSHPRPEGTIRFAFLGSSTTFDHGPTEQTWPHLTVSLLQEMLPGCRLDYLNAGVPGFSTRAIKKYYEHVVQPLQPDVVVLLPSGLSADAKRLADAKGLDSSSNFRPSWLAEHSALWFKIEKNIQVIQLQRSAHLRAGKLDFTDAEFSQAFSTQLTELLDVLSKSAAVTVVATISSQLRRDQPRDIQVEAANSALFYMPYMSIEGLLRAREIHNDVIRTAARAIEATLVDGEDDTPGTLEYFLDTAHFTAAGSALMAKRAARQIASSAAFRELLATRPDDCAVHADRLRKSATKSPA